MAKTIITSNTNSGATEVANNNIIGNSNKVSKIKASLLVALSEDGKSLGAYDKSKAKSDTWLNDWDKAVILVTATLYRRQTPEVFIWNQLGGDVAPYSWKGSIPEQDKVACFEAATKWLEGLEKYFLEIRIAKPGKYHGRLQLARDEKESLKEIQSNRNLEVLKASILEMDF